MNVQFTHAVFALSVFHFAVCIRAATFYFFSLLISVLGNENIWMAILLWKGNKQCKHRKEQVFEGLKGDD